MSGEGHFPVSRRRPIESNNYLSRGRTFVPETPRGYGTMAMVNCPGGSRRVWTPNLPCDALVHPDNA